VLVRKANAGRPTLGQASLQVRNGRVTFASITLAGSPWYNAGLDSGDQILTLDGVDVTTLEQVNQITARHRPGDTVPITFMQRGETRNGTVTFAEDARLETLTHERAGTAVTDAMLAFRADWLGTKVTSR
jgi:predicted metalloprotease with PDZ domain